jgi:tellurium resistance protein TerD
MGWKVNPSAKPPYGLDASTFLLRANGEIGVEEDFVFLTYPQTPRIDPAILQSSDDYFDSYH